MDMSGERMIAAPVEKIWAALNDPVILKTCIPGCESVEKLSDTQARMVTAVKVGPIAARFTGNFTLSDIDPPNGYTISGEGQGGLAGTAKGSTRIKLTPIAGGTKLRYQSNIRIDGRISQLDAHLIDAAAKYMVESFFMKLSAQMDSPATQPVEAGTQESPYHHLAEDHDHDPSNPHFFGLPIGVIIAAVIATIAVGLTVLKYVK